MKDVDYATATQRWERQGLARKIAIVVAAAAISWGASYVVLGWLGVP